MKTIALLIAFIAGFLFPELHHLKYLVPWFVRFMLLMIFLQFHFRNMTVRYSHYTILLTNLTIGIIICEVFRYFGEPILGEIAFFLGSTPTATAASTVMGFLGGNIDYVVTSFILNTFGISLSIPFTLPWVLRHQTPYAFLYVGQTVFSIIIVPFLLARLLRWIYPKSQFWSQHIQGLIFVLWTFLVAILCAYSSYFIRTSCYSIGIIIEVGAVSFVMCVINFGVGYLLGEKNFKHESSQSLGQKNTGSLIYLAMLYGNPLSVLGLTFYVLWHNLWNAIQLKRADVRK
ncbi:MAG: hypothetical protein Q4C95_08965 [Planctomycetia bacterium]|nr:hypothetical protein [Planctomycetia bacterium]